MNFQIEVLLSSFFISIVLAIIIIPVLKKFKVGQIERDDGPSSHLSKQGTPTMGGIIMMTTMTLCIILIHIYYKIQGMVEIANNLIPILFLTLGFGIVGFIDDFKKLILKNTKGLKPKYKMLGLLIISIAYVFFLIEIVNIGTDTYIPILKQYINLPIYIYALFAIVVILATTNAVNLTDGIDGLSSSVSTIIITCLTIIGMNKGIQEISIFGSVVIRCNIGIFNV